MAALGLVKILLKQLLGRAFELGALEVARTGYFALVATVEIDDGFTVPITQFRIGRVRFSHAGKIFGICNVPGVVGEEGTVFRGVLPVYAVLET